MHIQTNMINIVKYKIIEVFEYIYSIDVYRDFFIAVSATIFSVIVLETIILLGQWHKHVKTKGVISKEVTERFKNIENFEAGKEKHAIYSKERIEAGKEKFRRKWGESWRWGVRQMQWHLCISELKTLAELNYTRLKHDQYTEFIDILNTMEAVLKLMEDEGKAANSINYGDWLKEFKQMKWLKIPIEKLDFKK